MRTNHLFTVLVNQSSEALQMISGLRYVLNDLPVLMESGY